MGSERWVTADDVATHLGISRDTVYRWHGTKGLPAHRIGRAWRFKLGEIDEWVRTGAASGVENSSDGNPQVL